MTLNGAIMQLVEMRENSMMPDLFKPYFNKVIETISECIEPSEIPHWIPCSERLSKPYDDVIISAKNYVCEAHLRESEEYFLTHNARMFIKTEETDAWMPLPKAYEWRTE